MGDLADHICIAIVADVAAASGFGCPQVHLGKRGGRAKAKQPQKFKGCLVFKSRFVQLLAQSVGAFRLLAST